MFYLKWSTHALSEAQRINDVRTTPYSSSPRHTLRSALAHSYLRSRRTRTIEIMHKKKIHAKNKNKKALFWKCMVSINVRPRLSVMTSPTKTLQKTVCRYVQSAYTYTSEAKRAWNGPEKSPRRILSSCLRRKLRDSCMMCEQCNPNLKKKR